MQKIRHFSVNAAKRGQCLMKRKRPDFEVGAKMPRGGSGCEISGCVQADFDRVSVPSFSLMTLST
jgi:hypothetical protein